MICKPLHLAAWLAVFGLSFGLALRWGWLLAAGLAVPLVVLAAVVVWPFFYSQSAVILTFTCAEQRTLLHQQRM